MFEITIDLSSLENFQAMLEQVPARVDTVLAETMKQAQDLGYSELTKYPEPPTYPVAWDSEKQRRAFFASSGFGGGIPHQRQGALPGSFQESEVAVSAGLIEARVFTPEAWAKFVMGSGDQQSNIHRGRWETDAQIGERITPEVRELFATAIQRAITEGLNGG